MDIGYNAIRAVVYENNKIGAPEIFNNKFKSSLRALLDLDSFDIKHPSYLTLKYFLHIFKNLNVTEIKCVATAVLRDHDKAQDFINHIKQEFDFDITVLSGEEEARLTTQGLIKGTNESNGIAADLGGGSLELAEIENNKIGKLASLELGTKVINSRNIKDLSVITEIIKKEFGNHEVENLYFIGGSLRFIGRLYIDYMHYPIKNLHNLEISIEDFHKYLQKIETVENKDSLAKAAINANAILVAKAMIEIFNPKKIVISTYGLKEGVRFESLSQEDRNKKLVEEKVKYACHYKDDTDFEKYFDIFLTLLPQEYDLYTIFKLSIILNSLKHRFDKTLPPKAISEYIMSSEIPFTHRQRIMLTLVLSYTSTHRPDYEMIKLSKKMISKKDYAHSQIIGHFIRIVEEADGPIFTKPSFSFNNNNGYIEIKTTDILPRTIFDKICHRLKSIVYLKRNII